MIRGAFSRFDHDHYFESTDSSGAQTLMRDVFDFTSPLGLLGVLVDRSFLIRHIRILLLQRNQTIRETAETERWTEYLDRTIDTASSPR
jgi:hypothetical protein